MVRNENASQLGSNFGMKFKLEIDCDNAAFGETMAQAEAEVSWILADVSRKVISADMRNYIGRTQHHTIRDTNGNSVGTATFVYDNGEAHRENAVGAGRTNDGN